MALRNLVYSYSATWQGMFADGFGYAATLRLDAVIAFLPLLAIIFLKPAKAAPLTGRTAARHLRKFAAGFALLAPVAITVAGGWDAPDWRAGAAWGAALLALWMIAAGAHDRQIARAGIVLAICGVALFFLRWPVQPWGRPAQLTLLGAMFAVAALGMILGARYEARKEGRLAT
jgi:hypothetical protein